MELGTRRSPLGFRLTKWKLALLSIGILTLILTFGLRDAISPQTIQVVDGGKYLQPIYGEGQNVATGYSDRLAKLDSEQISRGLLDGANYAGGWPLGKLDFQRKFNGTNDQHFEGNSGERRRVSDNQS